MNIRDEHTKLIASLAQISPKPLPTYPEPEDFLERVAHMREIALAVDQYILALGRDCQENSRTSIDLSLFTAPLTNALDGNASYDLQCCADEIAAEDEMYHEAKYEGVG